MLKKLSGVFLLFIMRLNSSFSAYLFFKTQYFLLKGFKHARRGAKNSFFKIFQIFMKMLF